MTLVIVSLAIVALLGGLLTSASISATHRNISNLDAVLRSLAETARYDIETQASFGPSRGPQFQPCAQPSQYKVVSNPYPQNGAVGTAVTVFTVGLTSPWSVTVGGQSASLLGTPVGDANGTNLTFLVPSLAVGQTYPVIVNGVQAATGFAVQAGNATPASPLAGYKFTTNMTYWDGSAFSWHYQLDCQGGLASHPGYSWLQQLTLRLAETETNNAASDHFDVVLSNLKPLAVPTVTVTPPGPYPLGSHLSMVAAVSGVVGVPAPTGSIGWSAPAGISTAGCTTTIPASCTIANAGAGRYYAQYSGDANYIGEQSNVVTVQQASPVITVALTNPSPPTAPVDPASLTYVATFNGAVAGFTPTGKVTFAGPCNANVSLTAGSPPTATCTVSGVSGGAYTETATYAPGTDPNYNAGTAGTVNTTVLYSTSTAVSVSSSSPGAPSTLTFTATVSGSGPNIGTGAAVNWSLGCTSETPLTSAAPYTSQCTVLAATAGTYSETATYTGNTQNATSTGGASQTLLTSSSTTVVGTPTTTGHPTVTTKITFKATVAGSAGTPTGNITWSIATKAGNTLGTATCTTDDTTLTNGQASCEIDGPTQNVTYTATANYLGDGTYTSSYGTSQGVKA